jgi:hypothetical protein
MTDINYKSLSNVLEEFYERHEEIMKMFRDDEKRLQERYDKANAAHDVDRAMSIAMMGVQNTATRCIESSLALTLSDLIVSVTKIVSETHEASEKELKAVKAIVDKREEFFQKNPRAITWLERFEKQKEPTETTSGEHQ